jgi:hypothetical protein
MDYVIKNTKNYEKCNVYLKRTKKGVSVFARKPFKKGDVVAFYKFKIFKSYKSYKGVKNGTYLMTVYKKNKEIDMYLIGDICNESLDQPTEDGLTYYGYFSNEPSDGQTCNVYLNTDIDTNYKDRDVVKEGDFLTYRLVATRDIQPDEEICWYYGDEYPRNYEVSDRS